MKLFSAEQIRRIDLSTIEREPVASIDLMERAAQSCADWISEYYEDDNVFHIFCGMGNNGGDGLALARLLADLGYRVEVQIVAHRSAGSTDFDINLKRLDDSNVTVNYINGKKEMPEVDEYAVAIDAIVGSGLSKPLRGIIREVVEGILEAYDHVISIDVPTGIPSDLVDAPIKVAVHADHTLTFQFPKLSFFIPETGQFTGDIHVLDIGLDEWTIEEETSPYHLTMDSDVEWLRPMRNVFSHKGDYGHALIVGGHEGMMGAAVLATKAALRSGAGLVTAHIPGCGRDVLQISAPEAMVQTDHNDRSITSVPVSSRISAIGIGPGLGREHSVFKGLERLLESAAHLPLVLDADALHLLATSQAWNAIPKGSILTPHKGEFLTMLGKESASDIELLEEARRWSVEYQCITVLKGAYTAVCNVDGQVYFNSTGHPAMASGGSGDVLTGILTGLLAQGLAPFDAARYGVWLHGCAGEEAAAKRGEHAVVAGDLIESLF